MVSKIVSGGQTGVDRAALDVALSKSMDCGGWCPAGRRAEDGPIAPHYPLTETLTKNYLKRTKWNVRDSDATLILLRGLPTGGTAQTIQFAERLGKSCLVVDLNEPISVTELISWLEKHNVQTLNIAGPRESTAPGIYQAACNYLAEWLETVQSRSA